jgi:hypothetical protein
LIESDKKLSFLFGKIHINILIPSSNFFLVKIRKF